MPVRLTALTRHTAKLHLRRCDSGSIASDAHMLRQLTLRPAGTHLPAVLRQSWTRQVGVQSSGLEYANDTYKLPTRRFERHALLLMLLDGRARELPAPVTRRHAVACTSGLAAICSGRCLQQRMTQHSLLLSAARPASSGAFAQHSCPMFRELDADTGLGSQLRL
jgi:hypothetical protein